MPSELMPRVRWARRLSNTVKERPVQCKDGYHLGQDKCTYKAGIKVMIQKDIYMSNVHRGHCLLARTFCPTQRGVRSSCCSFTIPLYWSLKIAHTWGKYKRDSVHTYRSVWPVSRRKACSIRTCQPVYDTRSNKCYSTANIADRFKRTKTRAMHRITSRRELVWAGVTWDRVFAPDV